MGQLAKAHQPRARTLCPCRHLHVYGQQIIKNLKTGGLKVMNRANGYRTTYTMDRMTVRKTVMAKKRKNSL
jgi:hypothetical protein